MTDCIFCKIIEGRIPAKKVYEDDRALAFEDINPQAPVHTIVIPKKHIPTILDMTQEDHGLLGYLVNVANKIAHDKGIAERGFRVVINCNPESGQTVYHIHLHMLGGRIMQWPPG